VITIKTIRHGRCDDCHEAVSGVEFVVNTTPGAVGFLCWKDFRATLEALHGHRDHSGDGSLISKASAESTGPQARDAASDMLASAVANDEGRRFNAEQTLRHGETKGGTDGRDTGGEG
jgi:hypothetical protein